MKFIKKFRYPLFISLSLIFIFFIFQNGSCDNSATTSLPVTSSTQSSSTSSNNPSNTNSNGNSTSTSIFTLNNASTTTISVGGAVQLFPSGGTRPYTFSVSDDETISSSGLFRPSTSGIFTLTAQDASSTSKYITVTVNPAPIAISPSTTTVAPGDSIQFTPSGGTPPYTFSKISGSGKFSKTESGYYTVGTTIGSDQIQVIDSLKATSSATINIVKQVAPTTPLTVTPFSICLDNDLVITYTNSSDSTSPTLTFLGTGGNAQGVGANKQDCPDSPFMKDIQISNFINSTSYKYSFRGIISASGRRGQTSIAYCIDPSDNSLAYWKNVSGNGFVSKRISYTNPIVFDGAEAIVADTELDNCSGRGCRDGGGAAPYAINISGKYSVKTDCKDMMLLDKAGNATNIIQVQPF